MCPIQTMEMLLQAQAAKTYAMVLIRNSKRIQLMHTLIQAVETGTILALTILLLKDVDIDGQSCI